MHPGDVESRSVHFRLEQLILNVGFHLFREHFVKHWPVFSVNVFTHAVRWFLLPSAENSFFYLKWISGHMICYCNLPRLFRLITVSLLVMTRRCQTIAVLQRCSSKWQIQENSLQKMPQCSQLWIWDTKAYIELIFKEINHTFIRFFWASLPLWLSKSDIFVVNISLNAKINLKIEFC